jgi:hypothetical protein
LWFWFSCCIRYREFDVGFNSYFLLPGRCWRFGVPTAFATAGLMLALLFIFIDPCAGRHSLSLLTFFGAAKKVSAAPPRVNENKK